MIGSPRTNPILKILVPIIFPRMISNSPFLAEVMAITSSGEDVPITKITIVINFCEICSSLAMFMQLLTAISLPTEIMIKPKIEKITDWGIVKWGVSLVNSWGLFFLLNW